MADKLLYRVSEASEVMGLGRSKIYQLMESGEIESVKIGKARLIPADALHEFVARLRRDQAPRVRNPEDFLDPDLDDRK